MNTSAQLENEAERTRADLAHTLDELRSRLTVGQVVDEVWHYTREGLGGDFVRNLGRQVANNPMPVALMGAGIAWMMFGGGRASSPSYEPEHTRTNGDGAYEATAPRREYTTKHGYARKVSQMIHNTESKVGVAASSAASGIKGTAESIGETASSAYHNVADGAAKAASTVKETASSAYESAADTASMAAEAVGEKAQLLAEEARTRAERLTNYAVDHPLVLAGVGLAVGAAIGALLPTSEMENRLFGPTSDDVKRKAENLAAQQVQKAEQVGEQALDKASSLADRAFGQPTDQSGSMPIDRMGTGPTSEGTRH